MGEFLQIQPALAPSRIRAVTTRIISPTAVDSQPCDIGELENPSCNPGDLGLGILEPVVSTHLCGMAGTNLYNYFGGLIFWIIGEVYLGITSHTYQCTRVSLLEKYGTSNLCFLL